MTPFYVADSFRIRLAAQEDIPALRTLIERSVRLLQAQDYSPAQIEGALGTVFGVDSQLIADQTYYVVERPENPVDPQMVGCGGWSKRKTLFGGDHGSGREDHRLDPRVDNARIRAFFVHPDWARHGIGSLILDVCESAAIEAGFRSFELGATITGERLYSARGYRRTERIEVALINGATLPVIRMWKAASISPTSP